MTKRSRYTLIGIGILAFFIIAPTLLWYVQGKPIGKSSQGPENTGIIAVETDPRDAEIWVNGEKRTTSPGAVRFLETGRYTVEIRKPGYRTWQKTVSVIGSRVTHVNPNPAALKLTRESAPELVASGVTAAAVRDNQIAYSTEAAALVLLKNDQSIQTIALPAPATNIRYIPGTDRYIVRGGAYTWLVDPATAIHASLPVELAAAEIHGVRSSLFLLTAKQELRQTTLAKPTSANLVASGVRAFTTHGSELYYLAKNDTGTLALHHSTVENDTLVQTQVIPTDLTDAAAELFIDEQKAVYVLQAGTIYRIGEHPTELARGVTSATTQTGVLAYTTPGELWWYDSRSLSANLVSRTSTPIRSYLVAPASQLGIYTDTDGLAASELNADAGQNRYLLDPVAGDTTQVVFWNQEQIVYLSGPTLKQLKLF